MNQIAFPQSGAGKTLGQRLASILFIVVIVAGAVY